MPRGLFIAPLGAALLACASAPLHAPPDPRGKTSVVFLSAFEVRDDGVDRFEHCPPAGDIGQEWLPPLPEWHAPPAPAPSPAANAPASPSEGPPADASPGDQGPGTAPASPRTLTENAERATRLAFRRCYLDGLMADPTQDGHVGVVLRVDDAGRVARVEEWGACDLAPRTLRCMRDEAARVRLPPPALGSATVTLPAVFTSGAPRAAEPGDALAAAAYGSVESVRDKLHACVDAARRERMGVAASAVLSVDLDAGGRGVHVAVDDWKGSQPLLACAAEVVRAAPFPRPPAGQGRVVVPVVFNPRAGTR